MEFLLFILGFGIGFALCHWGVSQKIRKALMTLKGIDSASNLDTAKWAAREASRELA
jgi:hypothetical protein